MSVVGPVLYLCCTSVQYSQWLICAILTPALVVSSTTAVGFMAKISVFIAKINTERKKLVAVSAGDLKDPNDPCQLQYIFSIIKSQ